MEIASKEKVTISKDKKRNSAQKKVKCASGVVQYLVLSCEQNVNVL